MVRHIFSPSPDPCLNSSNFLKRSNTLSILSAGMPGPVSLTENVILSGYSVSEQCRWISPFFCVLLCVGKEVDKHLLQALFICGDLEIVCHFGGIIKLHSFRFSIHYGESMSLHISLQWQEVRFMVYLPLSSAERSRISLTSVVSSSELCWTSELNSSFSSSSNGRSGLDNNCENPTMALSGYGFRGSCSA